MPQNLSKSHVTLGISHTFTLNEQTGQALAVQRDETIEEGTVL